MAILTAQTLTANLVILASTSGTAEIGVGFGIDAVTVAVHLTALTLFSAYAIITDLTVTALELFTASATVIRIGFEVDTLIVTEGLTFFGAKGRTRTVAASFALCCIACLMFGTGSAGRIAVEVVTFVVVFAEFESRITFYLA